MIYREPAFPSTETNEGSLNLGMSLRDYFAAKALQGLLANSGGPIQENSRSGWGYVNTSPENIATDAYALADAMLNARNE